MFLKDRGYIKQDEPFQKLINQGMILGMSAFVYKLIYNFYEANNQLWDESIAVSYTHLDVYKRQL